MDSLTEEDKDDVTMGFTFLTLYLFRLFAALPSKPLSTKLFSDGQGVFYG